MTSHIQVAKANKLSVKAVHEKAIALNKIYFLNVFKSGYDNKWHGAVWKKEDCTSCHQDECKGCVQRILTFCEAFQRPHEAACDLNARIDGLRLTENEEQRIGLTSADLSLLKKLEVRPSVRDQGKTFQMKHFFDRALY